MCPGILSSELPIALGTDSALTAEGDLIDELRTAAERVDSVQLYRMVTSTAARILRLECGAGHIRNGGAADLLVVRDQGQTAAEALVNLRPEAVFVNGKIRMLSEGVADRFRTLDTTGYERLNLEGRGCFRMPFAISKFLSLAEQALGAKLTLAGKAVCA